MFLSGMGKSFNQMDSRAALVLHSRMGIGADAIDPEHRVRQATLPRQIIRQSMKLENLAEGALVPGGSYYTMQNGSAVLAVKTFSR